MIYPYNKYGFKDFIYSYFKAPYHNFKLTKRAGFPYHKWDIIDSLIELTFQQFKDFYESYPNVVEISNEGWEEHFSDDILRERDQDRETIKNIYTYITSSRKANEITVQKLWESIYGSMSLVAEKLDDEEFYTMKTSGEKKYKLFTYKINEAGLIILLTETPCESNKCNIHHFDGELFNLDSKFCKKIIDMRKYFAD